MRTSTLLRSIAIPVALISVVACGSKHAGKPQEGTADGGAGDPTGSDVDPTATTDTSAATTDDSADTTAETSDEPVGPMGDPDNGVFESSNPSSLSDQATGGRGVSEGAVGGDSAGAPTAGDDGAVADPTTPSPEALPQEESPERAIEEADVIKREGDRLYALSALGGLTIVDISDPDALKILGRHRSTATPFEMYVRDEVVFVLYNGYAEYLYDEATETYTYYQTSYVIPLDTSDPEAITEADKFEVSGYIADSRLVGDVMYVVAYDDSYCYNCGDTPATHVVSLDLSDPKNVSKVDELSFEDRLDEYSWGRSLSGTDERLYIAGPRYGSSAEPEGSIIQVVDIADATGDMKEGASLEVAGQINSRWQMDEFEGVLRVVSQPLWWTELTAPSVETFTIESSTELTALGNTQLVLPEAETLQTVRFDGTRAYAITFQQTDPLFTIDLSDPANPAQKGELQMPGWVYYMEPRGDRLIGLGFDQGNADGGLTVSLFDVSDLTTPTMIDRVNFGGQWGNLAEDQNRIHKSFQVLDSEELILVPFSGNSYTQTDQCTVYTFLSGVQLINWADDDLTLAGVAESQGLARRALLHKERLITMSDERLESFDIADRNAPESTSKVELARIVNQLDVSGDSVVRLGTNYWTSQGLEVTVSSLDDLVDLKPGVTVELPDINTQECNRYTYLERTLSGDGKVYYVYRSYNYTDTSKTDEIRVTTLDVADPQNPSVVGDASLGFAPQYQYNYVPGMLDNGQGGVVVGDRLVFTNHNIVRNDLGFITKNDSALEVVDFSDPAAPVRSQVALPASLGSTSLLKSGDVLATSHFVTSPTNPDNVRFYLDRIDFSEPSDPQVKEPVNIPGSLVAYDAQSTRALTLDYRYVEIDNISPKQCYEVEFGTFATENASWTSWEDDRGLCSAIRFTLHLVSIAEDAATVVGSYPLDKGIYINTAAIGDDRVFIGTNYGNLYYYGVNDVGAEPALRPSGDIAIGGRSIGYGYYSFVTGDATLLVASGLGGGALTVASMELEVPEGSYGISGLVAKGQRAVVAAGWQGKMSVIDASDATAPEVTGSIELPSYVSDLDLVGNIAVAALGQAGVQTISLE